MTPAETHLWERLTARKLNDLHFRRQHPVSKFIVDFYCHKFKLAFDRQILFVRSWNEWAERNVFEPTEKHGIQYLEVVKKIKNE